MLVVLDVDPLLSGLGQTGAIIICLFLLVLIIITVALAVVMVFATAWLREKADLVKMVRPTVDSVNKTSEAAIQGELPAEDKNAIVRTIAKVPAGMHTADKKVDEATDKVAQGVIEFRARTLQAQTVVKAFLFPGARTQKSKHAVTDDELQSQSPGYRELVKEKVVPTRKVSEPGNGYARSAAASQLKDASLR